MERGRGEVERGGREDKVGSVRDGGRERACVHVFMDGSMAFVDDK